MTSHLESQIETSEPVRRVLRKLRGVRRLCRGHYQAPCPLDPSNMLTVSEGKDGRAMIECDDCCWLCEIVPALGLATQAEPSGRWWCGPIVFDDPRSFPDRIDVH